MNDLTANIIDSFRLIEDKKGNISVIYTSCCQEVSEQKCKGTSYDAERIRKFLFMVVNYNVYMTSTNKHGRVIPFELIQEGVQEILADPELIVRQLVKDMKKVNS